MSEEKDLQDGKTDTADAERWEAAAEGAELIIEGSHDAAVAYLSEVLRGDPDNAYACFFLGNAHYEAERLEPALKAYVRALEISPDYLGAMIAAGHTLRLMGRTDQAIRLGRQALLKRPEDSEALHLLGYTHFQRDEKKKAGEYLQRFLETNPEIETALEVEGMMQVIRGEVLPLAEANEGGDSDD